MSRSCLRVLGELGESLLLDAGCWILDAGCWILDAGYGVTLFMDREILSNRGVKLLLQHIMAILP